MPQDAGDGRGGCWGRRQAAERPPEARSGPLTPIFSYLDCRVTSAVAMRDMRALHFPNPRVHVGMRVMCVRPRPKISFPPPSVAARRRARCPRVRRYFRPFPLHVELKYCTCTARPKSTM
eukprot:4478644-Prymnesium_polylepis.1